MKTVLVQRKHVLGDKQKNLEIIQGSVEKYDADLMIFPEMFLTGYTLGDRVWSEAEKVPGPSSSKISSLSKETDTTIICGMPEIGDHMNGRLYNSALVTTPDGSIDTYRKRFLPNFGPFQDKRYYHSGGVPDTFDTPFGRLGVVICYDLFFPELTKSYALKGADVIACISASPSTTRVFFERVMTARAIETTCLFFYVNLLGREDQMMFWGGNEAISPKGERLAKGPYFEESVVVVDVDLAGEIQRARRGRPAISDSFC